MTRSRSVFLVLSCAFSLACAAEPTPPAEYSPREAAPVLAASETPPAQAAETEPAPTAPPPPVQVIAGDSTPLEGPAPTLKIRAPRANQLLKDKVEVSFALERWTLSPDGNHVHLIVDNEPYIAVRDVSKPIDLLALVQAQLGHELSEGTHVLRAFPSRGHHESVKDAGAFASVVFHFKKKSEGSKPDLAAPLLTYSRPKGCVEAGKRMLVDFFVTNTKLAADGARVRLTIDALPPSDIVQWAPHYVENLGIGSHVLRLALVDAKGEPVAGPFNDTTRTIEVQTECKPTTPAAAPPSAATTAAPAAAAPAATPPATPGAPQPPSAPAAK